MNNRLKLFLRYLKNDRIKEYRDILSQAKINGYQMISLENWADGKFDENKPLLILRHDVDHISKGTNLMYEAEKIYGAYASYYFRNSSREITAERELIENIKNYGSEASLHFETIANYGEYNSIKDRSTLLKRDWMSECIDLLGTELTSFREKYNVQCRTIAAHGEVLNSLYGISNNALTEDTSVYETLGIVLEAYNKSFIDSLGIYISDVPMEINEGYRYGVSVVDAIKKGTTPILFLSHPNHWYYSLWKQFKKLVKMVIYRPQHSIQDFTRIGQ